MGKIICDLCGTSYSDTVEQCPICGSARPVGKEGIPQEGNEAMEKQYHHVSGGRFSKSNVRKRNKAKENSAPVKEAPKKAKSSKKSARRTNKVLLLVVIILLIAIFAVLAFDIVTLFAPELFGSDQSAGTAPTMNLTPSTEPDVPCTQITLEETEITIEEIGGTYTLTPVITPADTTDECVFSTGDDTIATVSSEGLITAVSAGETVITVTCGDISVTCSVFIPEPIEPFALDYEEITLIYAEQECQIYSGSYPVEEIIWASDDESVAMAYMGYVIAVAEGETTVYAGYNGEVISCVVRCEFVDPDQIPVTEPEEEEVEPEETEPFVDNGPYRIKNKFGFSDSDATISVGESFSLILIDKNGDEVSGVSWDVIDGDCCTVSDGTVTGVGYGQAKVVATYYDLTFTFLVRVS